jgi:hypothetical protein
VVLWTFLGLLVALVLLAVLMAWQARTAYAALTSASERIPQLREQVIADDEQAARDTIAAFRDETSTARDALHGPQWSLAGALPEVGPNIKAVQTVTEVVDDLGDGALDDLLEAAAVVDPANLSPKNGRIDLAPVERAAPRVAAMHEALVDADQRLAAVDTEPLLAQVRGPVTELSTTVADARSLTGAATKATRLLPSMLGAEEPRRYLLLAQNNSEPRALGGLPGVAVVIRVDDGRIKLLEHRAGSSLSPFDEPVVKLSAAERALYGTQMGRFFINSTSTPDFPRAAQIARKMWRLHTGQRVDGVAALDPYALQLLLRASGPVRLPTGQRLTGENAAQVLLNQTYLDIPDPTAQDAFFAAAAAAIFKKAMSGAGDMRTTVEALSAATDQGRVMVWSALDGEQAVIADTPLSGVLRGEHDGAPVVGVYLHDRSGAKIAYYEHADVEVRSTTCRPDGSQDLTAEVTLSSEVPRPVESLPEYLTGNSVFIPEGHIRTDVLLYAPKDGVITDVRAKRGSDSVTTHFHEGLQVARKTVVLKPGQSNTVTFDLRSGKDMPGAVEARVTPLASAQHFSVSTSQCK